MTAIVTSYPTGGIAKPEGPGIFSRTDTDGDGEGLRIWVDAALHGRRALIGALEDQGARISTRHEDEQTQLLILAPGSVPVFDLYCHPEWLGTRLRKWYYSMRTKGKLAAQESWQSKLILREEWIAKCIAAGRFLGDADDWGACRVGGPPRGLADIIISTRTAISTSSAGVGQETVQQDRDPSSPVASTSKRQDLPVITADQRTSSPDLGAKDHEDAEIRRASNPPPSNPPQVAETPEPVQQQADNTRTPEFEDILIDALRTEGSPVAKPSTSLEDQPQAAVRRSSSPEQSSSPETEATVDSREPSPVPKTGSPRSQPSPASSSFEMIEPIEELPPLPSRMSPEDRIYEEAAEQAKPLPKATTDPSAIFAGLRFWVDLKRPNRKDLITRIKQAGGGIAAVYGDATHVLVHQYKAADWESLVRLYVQEGVWFMHIAWAVKCLEQGVRLPELGEHVPGGAPVLLGDEKPDVTLENREARFRGESYMPTETIAKYFSDAAQAIAAGQTVVDAMYQLSNQHGTYAVSHWRKMYDNWRLGTGRFADLKTDAFASSALGKGKSIISSTATANVATSSAVKLDGDTAQQRLPIATLDRLMRSVHREILKGMGLKSISKRLAKEHGTYPPRQWRKIYHDRRRSKGRFRGWPQLSEVSTGSDLSPVKTASESSPSAKPQVSHPPGLPSVSQPRSVTAGDNSKPSRLTVEELDRLFGENAHLLNKGKTSRDVGEKLFHENGTYTIGTWTNYVNDWRYGEGKFAAATRSNLRPQSSATPTPTQKPLVRKRVASGSPMLDSPPSKKRTLNRPSAYTEEEERAMAAHIVDRLPDATRFFPREWEAFQAKHPKRSAAAYCERYRGHRARIDEYARQYADTQGVRAQLDNVLDDGSSGSQSRKTSEVDVSNEVIDLRSDSEDADYVDRAIAECM